MYFKNVVGYCAVGFMLVGTGWAVRGGLDARADKSAKADQMPIFVFDPTWPKMPLPNEWTLGNVSGVSVDGKDHIWILQRPFSITHGAEDGLEHNPPTASCCRMAPPVIEFDQAGNVGHAWGGPGEGYAWPQHSVADMHKPHDPGEDWSGEHGVYADYKDRFWISNNAPKGSDGHVLVFNREGKYLMTVGTVGTGKGSNDTTTLGKPAGIVVDPKANEVYVADGYKNRRVIVFDADTGVYKRHWGAYGKPPDDAVGAKERGCNPNGPMPTQFNTSHAVRLSNDDLVYVADRGNCRVQVFKKDGMFVTEAMINPVPQGNVFDIGFSADKEQRFLYVLDGRSKKVWILRRNDLKLLGGFGCGGHFPGCFYVPHNMAVDSKGNIYVADVQEGKRVQRFLYKGLGPGQTQ
jgi:hypothetical protein